MKAEIKVPSVGESITEATIAEWQKKNGDFVKRDEVLLVLETDKASVDVVAEHEGVLETKVNEGETVQIGAVIGFIDTEGKAAKTSSTPAPEKKASPAPAPAPAKTVTNGNGHGPQSPTLSPAVRRIVGEKNLDPSKIPGTGPKGHITKADAMTAAGGGGGLAMVTPEVKEPKPSAPLPPLPTYKGVVEEQETREPMSSLRKTIARRLVEAQHTAAILTTFNEIDMSAAMALRDKYKDSFKEKYGINLGFMGLFVKAAIEALKAFPRVNASIEGEEIVFRNFVNMGIAVSTDKGLLVPVIRHADKLSLAEIELSIRHFAIKAREGKISVDDLSGGTFTISNGGVFGSLMSTPILNPPQSGILGLHKIEDRPVAVNGQVVVRPMMYVALSYDHRIIDGKESVSFLVRIKECMEDPARILLEI